MSSLLASQPSKAVRDAAPAKTFLRTSEKPIVMTLLDAFIAHESSRLPDPRDCGVLPVVDRMFARLPAWDRRRIRMLLWMLDWAVLLRCPHRGPRWWRRMRHLDLAARREYLAGWGRSRIGLLRMAFNAIKSLMMLAYYTRPPTWEPIGYDGPWVGRVEVERTSVPRPSGSAGPRPGEIPGQRVAPRSE